MMASDGGRADSNDGMDSSRFFRGRMCREETWVATTNQEEADMDTTTVAVDLAKEHFRGAVANRAGRIIDRNRLTRAVGGTGNFTRGRLITSAAFHSLRMTIRPDCST